MDRGGGEDLCNTGPDDETLIREKKRLRRVSFAENTEVHVFDRDDEDFGETPPQPPQQSPPPSSHQNPQLGQLNDNNNSNDNGADGDDDCGDDEEDNNNNDFIRDMDSSSPGSAVSSATSNDEDNFFGPVSASFIRLGRQSDSAASDEHDITLDSTAFSMHFQSLAQSDSASNCKTPTPSFEGKNNSMPTNSESFMVMTRGKKPFTFAAAISGGDSSGGFDSSDMSLIGNNASDKFDYGRLSPTLDALLAHASVSDQLSVSKSNSHINTESSLDLQASEPLESNNVDTGNTPTDMVFDGNAELFEVTIGLPTTPISNSGNGYLSSIVDSLLPDTSTTNQSQTPTASIQKQGIHPEDLNQQDQYRKLTSMEQREESVSRANEANASADSANGCVNRRKLRSIGDKGCRYQTTPKEYGSVGDFLTPLRRGTPLLSPLGSSDLNFLTRTDPTKIGGKFSEQNPLHKSASPRVRKTATARRLEKLLLEGVIQNSVNNETQALSASDRLHPFLRKGPLSYATTQNSDGCGPSNPQSHKIVQETSPLQDFVSSGRKRRAENIEPMNDNIHGIRSKKPVVTIEMGDSVSESCMDHFPVGNDEVEKTGGYDSQGQWVNALKELPAAIGRLLLPSMGKLNTWELDMLEDILGRMQKATKYEKLSSLVQFQRTHDPLANNHQGRIAEAKWLQETLVYEQAKLLLLRTRQEQLRKKVQLLQSAIQETPKLKSCLKNVLQYGVRGAQKEDVLPSLSVDLSSESVDAYNKVITKQQELGLLDIKVKNLSKSHLASCKIKEEPSPDECVMLINDYLRRTTRCRLIQKELQLCKVDRLERKNGQHNLVLNYYNVLHQSFTTNLDSFSKLAIFNKLNNVDIVKSFPNMNAATAFAFVFDEAARSLVSFKSLAVQTQMTRSLLHSLLIVVGEVQLAGIELKNLVRRKFRSPCVGLLELELCFVDFKTGAKVLLILDMTCLIRGVYPLEIQPQISVTQKTTLESSSSVLLSETTEAAMKALNAGHSMIYRLCKCVSQVLDGDDASNR